MTDQPRSADVEACLRDGGVALLPTDTVYGLAALPSIPSAVERIFAIKNRPPTRSLPVMVAGREGLEGLGVSVPPAAEKLMSSPWMPGPLTIALGFGDGERPEWLAEREEMAFRVPDEPIMLEVLARTGALHVTSANMHAEDTLQEVSQIVAQLAFAPDIVVDDGPRDTVPSTLVNCAVEPPVVEREGVVSHAEIEAFLA